MLIAEKASTACDLLVSELGHFLYLPYTVYVVHAALSSIYIINSTISMKQKYIFYRKDASNARKASFRFPGLPLGSRSL
jgi:hypothetical protein